MASFETAVPPLERSFWIVPETLLGGRYPGDLDSREQERRLACLLGASIRAFIDLTDETDRDSDGRRLASYVDTLGAIARAHGVSTSYERCSLVDETAPSRQRMREILDVVDTRLRTNTPVYLHCWGGRGRTATVAGCWLARHGVSAGKEVLSMLRRARHRPGALDLPCPAEKAQRDLEPVSKLGVGGKEPRAHECCSE